MADPPARTAHECAGTCCTTTRRLHAPPRELLLDICSDSTARGMNAPQETTHDTSQTDGETLVGFLGKRQFRYAFQDVEAQARLVRAVIASGNKRADITRVYESTGHAQHARDFMKYARRMAAKDGLNLDALAGVGQTMKAEAQPIAHDVDAAVQGEDQLHGQQPIVVDACGPHAPQDAHPVRSPGRHHAPAPSRDDHLAQAVASFLSGRAFAYANGSKDEQARVLIAAVRGQVATRAHAWRRTCPAATLVWLMRRRIY